VKKRKKEGGRAQEGPRKTEEGARIAGKRPLRGTGGKKKPEVEQGINGPARMAKKKVTGEKSMQEIRGRR